jgi:hypothetical protein
MKYHTRTDYKQFAAKHGLKLKKLKCPNCQVVYPFNRPFSYQGDDGKMVGLEMEAHACTEDPKSHLPFTIVAATKKGQKAWEKLFLGGQGRPHG